MDESEISKREVYKISDLSKGNNAGVLVEI